MFEGCDGIVYWFKFLLGRYWWSVEINEMKDGTEGNNGFMEILTLLSKCKKILVRVLLSIGDGEGF